MITGSTKLFDMQHVTTTLELASLGARSYNNRYMDLHDIVFVFHGQPHEYIILFVTISLQGRREVSQWHPD